MSEAEITVSAVVVRDPQGRVLTVRKRGTTRFMLPGGKPEPGESALDAAVREFAEELGVTIESAGLTLWGTYLTAAANETATRLVSTVYEHPMVEVSGPAAEIAELRWLDPSTPDSGQLAPLLTEIVFPRLGSSGVSRVTIFAGASSGTDPDHLERASRLGAGLAERRIGLVFGGGRVGLMGAVADAALDAGGEVIGVMPQHLVDREIAHPGLGRLEVVGSMHERKQRMAELGDAFVALPGGGGTLDELFEVWTWQNLGLHAKPITLYGRQFWTPLLDLLDHLVGEGFVRADDRAALCIADDPAELVPQWQNWSPAPAKWTG